MILCLLGWSLPHPAPPWQLADDSAPPQLKAAGPFWIYPGDMGRRILPKVFSFFLYQFNNKKQNLSVVCKHLDLQFPRHCLLADSQGNTCDCLALVFLSS